MISIDNPEIKIALGMFLVVLMFAVFASFVKWE
jgi:hypothetical protein